MAQPAAPAWYRPRVHSEADAPPGASTLDRDLLVVALAILGLAALLQVTPARDGVTVLGWQLPELCSAKRFFDLSCPGCGLTRSFVVGVRGDLAGSFALHPVGALLLLLTAAQVPYRAARLLGLLRPSTPVTGRTWLIPLALGAAITLTFVVRIVVRLVGGTA